MLNEREEEEEKKRKKKEGEVCQPRIRVYGKRLFDSIFQSPEGVLVKRSEDRYLSPSKFPIRHQFFSTPLLVMEVMEYVRSLVISIRKLEFSFFSTRARLFTYDRSANRCIKHS